MVATEMLVMLRQTRYLQMRGFSTVQSPVRVRFAPSPTGFLHLGGFRTALLNYIFALRADGKFILRVEDTDQTRLVPEALKMIEKDLEWLGISPHESPANPGKYGPYIQSQRLSIYHETLETLIDSGHAYECFCTEKRLDLMRREAVKTRQKPRYDNRCRILTRAEVKSKKAAGEQYCVRFKLQQEYVQFKDLVYGDVEFNLTEMNYEGDPVILKSDGFPTYHFANVVDDHFMEITHVLRGVEWQFSTPKHIQMYRAFKWKPPEFAHLPLVHNKDGTKLSKRQGDISISHYRKQTYYPIALANFVTKSGGGFAYHGVDKIFSMKELADNFDICNVNTGGCRLDFALLEKLNQLELEKQISTNLPDVVRILQTMLESSVNLKSENYASNYLEKILNWCPERVTKLVDLFSPDLVYLWSQPNQILLSQVAMNSSVLREFIDFCQNKPEDDYTDRDKISTVLNEFSRNNKLNHNVFLKDLRIIMCGVTRGPPMVNVFQIFGKQLVCDRLSSSMSILSLQSTPKHTQTQSG